MSKVSACIITKDRYCITDTIKSVTDKVKEIIIVDTGSEPKYLEFLNGLKKQNNKIKLYNFDWNGSFSKARNYSIDKAKGDWVLIIDSDEVFEGEIYNIDKKYTHCFMPVYKFINDKAEFQQTGIRIFRNNPKIRYEYNIHETIENNVDIKNACTITDCKIVHYGFSEEQKKVRMKRNYKMLMEDKENPYAVFYLNAYRLVDKELYL